MAIQQIHDPGGGGWFVDGGETNEITKRDRHFAASSGKVAGGRTGQEVSENSRIDALTEGVAQFLLLAKLAHKEIEQVRS